MATGPHGPHPPLLSRGHFFGRLNPNVGVPLSGREDDDLVQELIDAGDQVLPVPGFVGNVAEELGVDAGQGSAWTWPPVPRPSGGSKLSFWGDKVKIAFFPWF